MKKKNLKIVCAVLLTFILSIVCLTACDFGKKPDGDGVAQKYTIQYTDDAGVHQLEVTTGMPYSIDPIPTKVGHTFVGLFDAAVGGTQYVGADGASLSPFTDGKNLVLFPQFRAKEYIVILDYQGAQVTGSRQFNVAYGSNLPELPLNLTKEHKEFTGWYTSPDMEGVQVADIYGLLPLVSVLNDDNFDLSGEHVKLYAGFEAEKFDITCCFGAGIETETLKVEYGSSVSSIVTKTRKDGKAPLTWSKSEGGEVWNGTIESNMVLYAVEYAPVIDFDSNGGKAVKSIVAREGASIILPTPTKDLAKFLYWEDMQGNQFTLSKMPANGASLKAVWQAKLVFDENGGTDVNDISEAAGTTITLPSPEKEGYIFSGWYNSAKEKFTSTKMPSTGMKLKAGWYKASVKSQVLISNTTSIKLSTYYSSSQRKDFEINLKDIDSDFASIMGVHIKVRLHFKLKFNSNANDKWPTTLSLVIGKSTEISTSNNYLDKTYSSNGIVSYQDKIETINFLNSSNVFYIIFRANSSAVRELYISDTYIDITYPETANLYL